MTDLSFYKHKRIYKKLSIYDVNRWNNSNLQIV